MKDGHDVPKGMCPGCREEQPIEGYMNGYPLMQQSSEPAFSTVKMAPHRYHEKRCDGVGLRPLYVTFGVTITEEEVETVTPVDWPGLHPQKE